jgi:prepilin-type N-terminal cleavage/methylation domain-containing protein
MCKKPMVPSLYNRGFTLIELLVVIAILGLLAGIALVYLNDTRTSGQNAAVLAQMYEYQKALELHYANQPPGAAFYPPVSMNANRRGRRLCIGDGLVVDENCMGSSWTWDHDPSNTQYQEIDAALREHMSSLPRFDQPQPGFPFSSPAYSGCTGTGVSNDSCTANDYSIWFLLEGTNQDCGRAATANASLSDEYTFCRLMPNSNG